MLPSHVVYEKVFRNECLRQVPARSIAPRMLESSLILIKREKINETVVYLYNNFFSKHILKHVVLGSIKSYDFTDIQGIS